MSEAKQFNVVVGDDLITFETGRLAGLAGGAVVIRQDDNMMLATATMSKNTRPIDFLPLSVDFEERMYATGRIPGSFFRREGRPGEYAILIDRLIDRPLRPLFAKDIRNEIQVIITPMSVDQEVQMDILAINAASAALTISDIPFGVAPYNGPVGAVRIGMIEGEFVINPTFSQMEESTLDLRIAGTSEAILMVECGADIIPEDILIEALELAHKTIQPFIEVQQQMAAEVGKPKREYEPAQKNEALHAEVSAAVLDKVATALRDQYDKAERNTALDAIEDELVANYETTEELEIKEVKKAFDSIVRTEIRRRIIEDEVRPDGRGHADIRELSADTGLSPRAHGSGLFTRGETQVLSFVTLGTPSDAQRLDTLAPITHKRYMHHYNFPPYSVGEARFLRGTSRREIGHGALAERALMPVLPSEHEFPYVLRVVSEVLSSNGSTSMASVCGSTLALMDAGVPINTHVAGIAMGLVKEGDNYAILTDIQGLEDHLGDMDFKVAGTAEGITALQMDIKITGLTSEVMAEALEQARQARLQIIDTMKAAIAEPRAELSPHAPRLLVVEVPSDKIGAIIGPGGKTIRALQDELNVKIDIADDGLVYIAGANGALAEEARDRIIAMTETAEIGHIYTGKVVRVEPYGAFIEILPGTDGMVHVSQLASERVERTEDVARVGEELTVMVTDISPDGKVRLSRQAVLEGWTAEEAAARDRGGSRRGGSGSRGRGGDRGGRGGDRGGRGGYRGGGNRR